MIGAIAGDIIGSVYEFDNIRHTDFNLFGPQSMITDDTVLTVAIADSIVTGKSYAKSIKEYGRKYPDAGYGALFSYWLKLEASDPYNSFGNGSAMRVSPVGFAFSTLEQVLEEAKKSAEVTHNHSEGIKGAQAVAAAIFLAKNAESKINIKRFIEHNFSYDLNQDLDSIRQNNVFNETCQVTVPQAIIAFLESIDYEDAIRKAVSIGGDSDTIACITGGIAQAHYKIISKDIIVNVRRLLPPELLRVVDLFQEKFMQGSH
jgi:ADP-ribosylglycohydrolase